MLLSSYGVLRLQKDPCRYSVYSGSSETVSGSMIMIKLLVSSPFPKIPKKYLVLLLLCLMVLSKKNT